MIVLIGGKDYFLDADDLVRRILRDHQLTITNHDGMAMIVPEKPIGALQVPVRPVTPENIGRRRRDGLGTGAAINETHD